MFFDQAAFSVELELWIPQDMEIDVDHNIGEIKIEEMFSSVRVRNNVGSVDVETEPPDGGRIRLRTNIGEIELRIPEDVSARISADVNVGSVDVSSPLRGLTSTKGFIGRDFDVTIGDGNTRIDLTVNIGSIDIRAK
jgi:predicted membrane protein